ncbi:unnamed protein product, partial [Rotaria magnacalcarata]
VNHALSSASSSSSESTTANPRSVSYIIEMEGKDGK